MASMRSDVGGKGIGLDIDPGDHTCAPPDLGEDASWTLCENEGYAKWRCPECGSRWGGSAGHGYTYRDDGKQWGYRVEWLRSTPSSRRWKKAERRRIEGLI